MYTWNIHALNDMVLYTVCTFFVKHLGLQNRIFLNHYWASESSNISTVTVTTLRYKSSDTPFFVCVPHLLQSSDFLLVLLYGFV